MAVARSDSTIASEGESYMSKRGRTTLFAVLAFWGVAAMALAAHPPRFERQFLGIRLMSRGISVLRKFGSPSKVLVGNDALVQFITQRLPAKDFLTVTVSGVDTTGTGGGPGGPGPYGAGPYGGGASPYPGAPPFPGASPYAPGGGAPGMSSGDTSPQPGKILFWVYEYPKKGLTNIFALDEEGRVMLIGQAGGAPSAKTGRGVGIGSTYAEVVRLYGFPDSHQRAATQGVVTADLLKASYEESHGVQFFFLNQRLRGYPNFTGQGPWCVGVIVSAAE